MTTNINNIIAEAKRQAAQDAELKAMPFYQNTVAMLGYVGLLFNNKIQPREVPVLLTDVVKAGALEPRIFEVLPALLANRCELLIVDDVPEDIAEVLRAIRQNMPVHTMPTLRGIPPEKYTQWAKHRDGRAVGEWPRLLSVKA